MADDGRLESALSTWGEPQRRGGTRETADSINDAACAQFRGIGGARERILRGGAGLSRSQETDIDSRRVMMIEPDEGTGIGADEADSSRS
ncbi:MAG: hypothetical protein V8Q42_09090 [Anaerovoracaceae bacterium]